jgi:hypothetical protein
VGPLSSIVVESKLMRQSGKSEALRCLAWLAQCGADGDDGEVARSAIDSRAINALRVVLHRGAYHSEEELPTRGLVNLLDELLVVRGQRDLGSPFSPVDATAITAIPLLLLLVHRLSVVRKDDPHKEEDRQKSKVTRVLLALGELVDHRELAKHAQQWRGLEAASTAALRRLLPAESSLLAALLAALPHVDASPFGHPLRLQHYWAND